MKWTLRIIVFLIIGAGAFYVWNSYINTEKQNDDVLIPPQEEVFDGKNATYSIEGEAVTLVNGEAETETETFPGAVSVTTTQYFGNEAWGDLNGDGKEDIAFLIVQDGGGSGLFYYAVVALKTDDGYKTTDAFFVGDRIAPQTTEIHGTELDVNYAERKPGEPMTARPSVGVTLRLKVTANGILEELKQ